MKKWLNICFVYLVIVCSVIGVRANPSPSIDGDVIEVTPAVGTNPDDNSNESVSGAGDIQDNDGIQWSFHENFEDIHESVERKIRQMNIGAMASDVLQDDDILYHVEVDLSAMTLLSDIRDLRVTTDAGENISKEYTNIDVTWEEPRLNENIQDIHILHYSTVRKRWEVFKPTNVDYENKTITAFFYDLSPVGVVYKSKEAIKEDEQLVVTSVKSAYVYFVIIVFGIVLALYAFYKARNHEEVN